MCRRVHTEQAADYSLATGGDGSAGKLHVGIRERICDHCHDRRAKSEFAWIELVDSVRIGVMVPEVTAWISIDRKCRHAEQIERPHVRFGSAGFDRIRAHCLEQVCELARYCQALFRAGEQKPARLEYAVVRLHRHDMLVELGPVRIAISKRPS